MEKPRVMPLRDPTAQELKQVLMLAMEALRPGVTLENLAAIRELVNEKLQQITKGGDTMAEPVLPGVGRFRKKPVVVQAIRLSWDTKEAVAKFVQAGKLENGQPEFVTAGMSDTLGLMIPTLEGVMEAWTGDWIVRGVKGEFYPVKDDIFRQTYEMSTTGV